MLLTPKGCSGCKITVHTAPSLLFAFNAVSNFYELLKSASYQLWIISGQVPRLKWLSMASPYVASGSLSQEDLHRMLSPRLAKLSAEREREQPSLRNRRPPGSSASVEDVEDFNVRNRSLPEQFRDLVRELSDYLLDSTFLDCIFDVHREASILHRHGLQIDSPPPTPSHEDSPQSSSDTPRSRPPESNAQITVKCRVCGRMVGAKVFEKHIINCRKLDGSRSSSRAAAKKIAEQEMISESSFNDDDFISPMPVPTSSGDDEDWNAPRKRRRTRKRKL
nr:unnamed protein product [Haemonchus contortus]